VLLIAAGIVLVLALAGTIAGFLGGLWWPLDLAANFRPHYALVLAAAGAVFAWGKAWKTTAVAVIGLVVNTVLVAPLYLGSPAPRALDSPTLKILAFNVTRQNDRFDEVLQLFEESNADLIFIFEGGPGWEEAINRADLSYDLSPGLRTAFGFGNAMLVRKGLEVEIQGVRVGPQTPQPRQLDMVLAGRPLRILAVHPPSPTSREKTRTRDEQLEAVAEWVEAQDRAVIVVGDLNTSPWSGAFRPLAASPLINSQKGFGLQATWPAFMGPLGVPIDHLLHSEDLTTVRREIGPGLGSEHRAVFVDVAWAAG
jgi:endonuclease/exonuclease/phosphatase (EEP) superfamily protein YafD